MNTCTHINVLAQLPYTDTVPILMKFDWYSYSQSLKALHTLGVNAKVCASFVLKKKGACVISLVLTT